MEDGLAKMTYEASGNTITHYYAGKKKKKKKKCKKKGKK